MQLISSEELQQIINEPKKAGIDATTRKQTLQRSNKRVADKTTPLLGQLLMGALKN